MDIKKLADLGKKFVVEPSGPVLTEAEKRLLHELQPAGIMFRKRNFLAGEPYETWLAKYSDLLKDCRESIGRKNLLVSIDHEGGRVIRPPLPITPFPYAAKWADQVVPVATAMVDELRSLGINVNFAPVADIHSNPDNPVINERAFGTTPKAVTEAVTKFATLLTRNQIVPCAKHFPGHGDTTQDSHFGLPSLGLTLEELRKRELIPFQALVDMGIPMVMTAHILFPKIDPESPATCSRKILHDLLRNEMGFKGVIIADALGMKAINAEEFDTTIKSLNAGLDLFLVAGDNVNLDSAVAIANHMQEALRNKAVSEETFQASLDRIDAMLNSLPQHPVKKLDAKTLEAHAKLAARLAERKATSTFQLHAPGFE